jgi:hypothetical protein
MKFARYILRPDSLRIPAWRLIMNYVEQKSLPATLFQVSGQPQQARGDAFGQPYLREPARPDVESAPSLAGCIRVMDNVPLFHRAILR